MAAFEKFGDWDIVANLCREMPADMMECSKQTLMVLAGRAEANAKKHIKAQDLNWHPLSQSYLAWKVQQGHDEKIYIQTGDYFDSITHFMSDGAKKSHAGIPKKAKSKSGTPIFEYAKIMEFGSIARNIPARPLWGPVLKEVGQFISDNNIFAKSYLKVFNKRARK